MTERRAEERIVLGAFATLTGRTGAPVHWNVMGDTPVGTLGLAQGPRGLLRLWYIEEAEAFAGALLHDFAGRPVLRSDALDSTRRSLDRYFSGKRLDFDVTVDLSALGEFDRKVLAATRRIPPGRYATYTEVAGRAGNPRASRAAGNALHRNPVAIIVPCHRVLRSDGALGGYAGGLPAKEWLLKHEGALLV